MKTGDLLDLAGRTAIVTGGSRGIGRAVALMLGRAGAAVGIGYRSNRAAAEKTVADLLHLAADRSDEGPRPWAEQGDLATREGVEALFARADAEFGGALHVFVANAGIWNSDPRPVADLEPDEWHEMMAANLTSAYLSTREAIRRMESGGRVVLITSTAAQRGEAGHSHYAASKGALQSFVKSLAVEVGGRGITVNAVAPGWVDTDMSAGVLQGPYREEVRSGIPVGRIGSPEDVAGPVVFLASDLARHVTGEVLNVNGGSVLCG
jgi:3-oxoacyl-[acyl-carrier protein] reductase